MNEITKKIGFSYRPELAIIVYATDEGDFYLESHSIKDGSIMEGKPLKQETIEGIVGVFFSEAKHKSSLTGMLPKNMLFFKELSGGKYKMIWHRPAEIRNLYFTESLHIQSGSSWVPPLLYMVDGDTLYIYALKGNGRPSENTKLYKAPFHNTYHGNNVCLGNAKVKQPDENTYGTMMKYWEDLFWLSEFTALNGTYNITKTNINILWKKLIESKNTLKWDTLNELIAIKKTTLKNILK